MISNPICTIKSNLMLMMLMLSIIKPKLKPNNL